MITIELATEEHAAAMASHLRDGDRAELVASGFATPLDGLVESLRISLEAYTVFDDGLPIAMMGVCVPTLIGRGAMPWLLTTEAVDAIPFAFVRGSRKIAAAMREQYGPLENWVDARYARAIKWLRLIGFTVHEPQPIGVAGAPFCRFEMRSA